MREGHGGGHAHLFALDNIPLHLFDKDSHSGYQILAATCTVTRTSVSLRRALVGSAGKPGDEQYT